MFMKLIELLKGYEYELLQGNLEQEIDKIAYDSRKVKENTLFVCQKGENVDGHLFAQEALKRGAVGLIVQEDVVIKDSNIAIIKVKNSRKLLSYISNVFYKNPSRKLNMVGITGTNGKTSISYLVSEILEEMDKKTGVIGTIGIQLDKRPLNIEKTTPTTPDSLELHMILNEMKKQNATDVIMEVTSIALDQYRVEDCKFEIGVFTNLTEDHLDFHATMENYKISKRKLFELCDVSVINTDDETGREYVDYIKAKYKQNKVITYGIENDCDLRAFNIKLSPLKTKFDISLENKTYSFEINLPGKFNVYNVLAAIATTIQLGVPMKVIREALLKIKGARGRFESVNSREGYSVVVDYAHTPDALENVLKTAREFNPNKIITVFGCGGNRDTTKRPMMGKISGEISDVTIITSDNPRNENPETILKDIENGIKQTNGFYEVIVDREEAIKKALKTADKEDIVIVAGKGHETYQIIKNKTIHFDDMEVVKKYIG